MTACGTRPGYRAHLKQHEVPCDACKRANADVTTSQRRRVREQGRERALTQARIERDIRKLVHVLACALGAGRQP